MYRSVLIFLLLKSDCGHGTMVDNSQKSRCECWATRSSVRSFAHTAHLFACSGLLASLAPSAALTCSLVRSHRSFVRLLRTARFARALRCAHLFARSLTPLICSLAPDCSLRSRPPLRSLVR